MASIGAGGIPALTRQANTSRAFLSLQLVIAVVAASSASGHAPGQNHLRAGAAASPAAASAAAASAAAASTRVPAELQTLSPTSRPDADALERQLSVVPAADGSLPRSLALGLNTRHHLGRGGWIAVCIGLCCMMIFCSGYLWNKTWFEGPGKASPRAGDGVKGVTKGARRGSLNRSFSSSTDVDVDAVAPEAGTDKPAALCSTLALPKCESRFAVPLSALAMGDGDSNFNIIGYSGNVLLQALVSNVANGRQLDLSLVHPGSTPRLTIRPPSPGCGNVPNSLEVCGPKGVHYGLLEAKSATSYVVTKEEQVLMTIECDTSRGVELTITTPDGKVAASASCSKQRWKGVEHLEVRVLPCMDGLLALGTLLVVVVPTLESRPLVLE